VPFTVSHAAAVLPLHRWTRHKLPLTALMIGSMAPDFLYFLPRQPRWLQSHSFAGLFYFCWPMGLMAWLAFVRLLERPTRALLPDSWRGAFPASDPELNVRALALASAALIVGALTHIIWDSFTHPSPLTDVWPVLGTPLFEIHGRTRRLWWLLQHLSTLLGAGVLWAWALRRRDAPRNPDDVEVPRLEHSIRVAAVGVVVAGIVACAALGFILHPYGSFERRLFHLAIGGMLGGVLAWGVVAAVVGRMARTRQHASRS